VRTAAPPSSPGPCGGAAAPKVRGTWSIRSASAAPSADADASSAAAARVPIAAAAAAWPVDCGSSARSGRSGADGECVWLSAYAEAKRSSCTVGRCCSSSRLRSSISRLRSRTYRAPCVPRQPHVSQRRIVDAPRVRAVGSETRLGLGMPSASTRRQQSHQIRRACNPRHSPSAMPRSSERSRVRPQHAP
jgi:hypothetical protein